MTRVIGVAVRRGIAPMITFACEHCGKTFKVAESFAGQKGACSQCGGRMQVPSPGGLPAVAPDRPARPIRRPDDPSPAVPVVEIAQARPIPAPAAQPHAPQQIVLQPVVNVTVQNTSTSTASAQASAVAIAGGLPRGPSRLGRIAMLMGVICLAGSWVPYLGMVLVPFALLGIVLGLAGFLISLVGGRSATGLPALAMLVNFAAFIVAVVVTARVAEQQQAARAGQPGQVVPAR